MQTGRASVLGRECGAERTLLKAHCQSTNRLDIFHLCGFEQPVVSRRLYRFAALKKTSYATMPNR
jgi:hypothetical protein